MRRSLQALGWAMVLLWTAAPAAHAAEGSRGVRRLATVAEPGIVSAKASGGLLYTSGVTGVSIYDIDDPRRPVRIGRLELPNVQNEDVDVGNGVLLVSDDPSGGRGILYVIDVRDPRRPRLLSRYSTWVPGLLSPMPRPRPHRRGGIGHTASCIQACRYVWLAGSEDGIEVVDLRDPRHPRFAGRFPAAAAAGGGTHDVQVDSSGLAWIAGGAGTAAYDTRRPVRPRLAARTDRRGRLEPWNGSIHHNSLRVSPGTLLITEEDFETGCRRAGSFQTWRIGGGRRLRPLDRFAVEPDSRAQTLCSAHYFDHSGGLVAAGFYEQGLRLLDVSHPRRIRQVGFFLAPRAMAWGALFAPSDPTGSVVYVIDHARGIDVMELDREVLAPVRRRPVRGRRDPRRFDVTGFVGDGFRTLRRGQHLRIRAQAALFSGRSARDVTVEVQLPRALTDVRPPRGATYDPATRTVSYRLRRIPGPRPRDIVARVRQTTALGSIVEVIAYARAPGDLLPITDRAVDRARVGRRTRGRGLSRGSRGVAISRWASPSRGPRLFCMPAL